MVFAFSYSSVVGLKGERPVQGYILTIEARKYFGCRAACNEF